MQGQMVVANLKMQEQKNMLHKAMQVLLANPSQAAQM